MKPRIFIGSSSEGKKVADAIQANLSQSATVVVWNQHVFRPGETILASLIRESEVSQFGIFVFTLDDIVKVRKSRLLSVRDNVLFELGLFIGKLGPMRSFVIAPSSESVSKDFRVPSDLLGVNFLTYETPSDDRDLVSALGPACLQVRNELTIPDANPFPIELKRSVLQRKESLTLKTIALLDDIERYGSRSQIELRGAFPKMDGSELHYRLEVLRLLCLVERESHKNNVRVEDRRYILHPGYEYARRQALGSERIPSSAAATSRTEKN